MIEPTALRVPSRCRRAPRWLRTAAGAVVALAAPACSGLTDVEAPDIVTPEELETPAGAEALRVGALAKFAEAVSVPAGESGQVGLSGLMADEFIATLTNRDGDRRNVTETTGGDLTLHEARVNLRRAIGVMQRHAPAPGSRIGRLFALVGYTEVFFGEHFCSGVPLSEVEGGAPVYGTPLTTVQMLERAIEDFDSALVYGTDNAGMLHLAQVGRGRALLALDRPADAAAAVAGVPTTFRYNVEYSATGQANGLFTSFYSSRLTSVSDREGINGLDFRSANDPRVPTELRGPGFDGVTPAYAFTRYNSLAAPIPLATGVEARLIEAEAALRANPDDVASPGSWLGILNNLRATAITPALAALADPGTPAGRVDLLFRERAFWLFGTGHRLGDLRRLVRQYGRGTESVFPTGVYRAGILYGTSVNYFPTLRELNNPNYTGCLSLGA